MSSAPLLAMIAIRFGVSAIEFSVPLLLLDEEHELLASRRRRQKCVSRLVRERVEILDRSGIRRDDLEHLARGQLVQRFLCLKDRQWTREPAGVEFLVEVHATSRFGYSVG